MMRNRTADGTLVVYGANPVLELLRSVHPVGDLYVQPGARVHELAAAARARDVAYIDGGDRGRPGGVAVVRGGEGAGVRPLVLRACDFVASIPMAPGVDSLNVAVAAGIALYTLVNPASGTS